MYKQINSHGHSYFSQMQGGSLLVKAACWVKAACLGSQRSRVRAQLWPPSFKEAKCFSPAHSQRFNIVESLCDREVESSAQTARVRILNPVSVRRAVPSHSPLHSHEVLLTQFNLYVHRGGLKPHSFHLLLQAWRWRQGQYTGRVLYPDETWKRGCYQRSLATSAATREICFLISCTSSVWYML